MIYIKKLSIWTFLFIVSILISFETLDVFSCENIEKKVFCTATMEDCFADDRILVVLKNNTIIKLEGNESNDFLSIGCTKVQELSFQQMNKIKPQISFMANQNKKAESNQVLSITLDKHSKRNVLNSIKQLEKNDSILYAGPDYEITMSGFPNDSKVSDQWAIGDINLPDVWKFTTGSSKVLVGILDTGIDGNHKDLSKSIIKDYCRDFTTGTERIVTNPVDANGHGTHIAGIVGAIGNNNLGIAGACWNVGLVSLSVLDSNGYGYVSNVAKAIQYAEEKDIPILNLSACWREESTYFDFALDTIIKNYSGTVVCAAGKQSIDNDGPNGVYPAKYVLNNLITVGAINSSNQKYSYSNFGIQSVNIYAPGVGIVSTYPGDEYKSMDGSSMATPYVTGVVALLLSINPNLTPNQLKTCILNSAESISIEVNTGEMQNVKKLNAFNALKYAFENYALDAYSFESNSSFSINSSIDNSSSYLVEKTSFIKLTKRNNYGYGFTIQSSYPIEVKLYNSNLEEVQINKSYTDNNCKVSFGDYLTSDTYYLKTEILDKEKSGDIKIDIHYHSYVDHYCKECNVYSSEHSYHAPYTWIDTKYHNAMCGCGATSKLGHVISSKTYSSGNRNAKCMLCGGTVELGFVLGPFSSVSLSKSKNGSFILPNGVIVLVDEDIEAYLNGTLLFFKENNLEVA